MTVRTWTPKAAKTKRKEHNAGYDITAANLTKMRIEIAGVVIVGDDGATFNEAIDNMLDAIAEANHPYFDAIDWERVDYVDGVSKAYLQATAAEAGVPFTITAIDVWNTGTSAWVSSAITTVVVGTGPNYYDNPVNWSGGVVPVDYDDIVFENTGESCCWGLSTYGVILPDSVTIEQSFEGALGLNPYAFATSADGLTVDTSIAEYRSCWPAFKTDGEVTIGQGFGNGSGRLNIYHPGCVGMLTIYNTASRARDVNRAAVNIWRVNTVNVYAVIYDAPGGVDFVENTELDELIVRPVNPKTWVRAVMAKAITNYGASIETGADSTLAIYNFGGTTETTGNQKIAYLDLIGGKVKLNNHPAAGYDLDSLDIEGGILDLSERTETASIHYVDFINSNQNYQIVSSFPGCFAPVSIIFEGKMDWVFV